MKKKIVGILICMLFLISGTTLAASNLNNPPYVPSNPHPEDGALDIGIKTHLSWCGGDPDPMDHPVYDIYFGNSTSPGLVASNLTLPNYYPGVLKHTTQYYWKVIAKDQNGGMTSGPEWTFTTNNCTCDPPGQPSGPTRVRNQWRYNYTTQLMNQSQNPNGFFYNFSWGDGNHTGWIGPFNYTERVRAQYAWEEPGIYQVQAQARFMHGPGDDSGWTTTGWSESLLIEVSTSDPTNQAPNAPEITGTLNGIVGVAYDYTFTATDPDGDDLYYIVSWGCCGGETHTYGPYISGEQAIINHTWSEKGTYTITAKAKDVYDVQGPEGTLTVTMPKTAPGGNGFMQQLRNRIRDMLGICQGGANLTELTGVLTYDGTNFYIGLVELHFGPTWYITSAMSAVDYDGDTQLELIIDELLGLVNTTVTVKGHYQSDNWMSVFTINGEVYREPGQPIWAAQHEWRWRYGHGNGGKL